MGLAEEMRGLSKFILGVDALLVVLILAAVSDISGSQGAAIAAGFFALVFIVFNFIFGIIWLGTRPNGD